MFATNLLEHRRKPDRVADQTWDQLVSAVGSAGDAVRSVRRHAPFLGGGGGGRMGPAAGEARQRAMAAVDALAGRRPGLPWAWIAGASAVGVALGWLASAMAKAAVAHRCDDEIAGRIEFVDADRPT